MRMVHTHPGYTIYRLAIQTVLLLDVFCTFLPLYWVNEFWLAPSQTAHLWNFIVWNNIVDSRLVYCFKINFIKSILNFHQR